MKVLLITSLLAGQALAAQPLIPRITPEALARLQQMDPITRLPQPAAGEATRIGSAIKQDMANAYLPKATMKIVTLDPDGRVPRTRVDQPFRVKIETSELLTGSDFPLCASSVLLERHIASGSEAASSTPVSRGYLTDNGQHVLSFNASAIASEDPTKASGEEHFVIHTLSDENAGHSLIASAKVQVLPVASGEIKGIATGDELHFRSPKIELVLRDLYPRSETCLILFEGTQYTGVEGTIVKAFSLNEETSESRVLRVNELESKLTKDGTYTLVLMSDTVYGREMLCSPVTFSIRRALAANATQTSFPHQPAP